jgi:hypothetical protein
MGPKKEYVSPAAAPSIFTISGTCEHTRKNLMPPWGIGLYFRPFSLNSHHYSAHQSAGSGLGPQSDPEGAKYMDVFRQMVENLSSIPHGFATIPYAVQAPSPHIARVQR